MASFSTANLSMVATMLLLGLLLVSLGKGVQSIGVCYGMIGDLPDPQEVVSLYKSNNINRMRLYYPDDKAFSALKGSNIDVILDVPREELQALASDKSAAAQWVEINIRRHWPDVKFRYITVGNEVIPRPSGQSGDYSLAQYVHPAMENIHEAISSAGLQDSIKVSTAVQMGVLGKSSPPSEGSFADEANNYMRPIVEFLVRTGAPLLAHVYPYFAYVGDSGIDLEFALFKSTGQSQYQNLFDSMVDALYSALEKAGGPNVKIVVSESGWPSLGGKGASKENAQTYNSNLIKHVPQGTPKRPGEIETYIFAMFNENRKEGAETERNFGLFYPSKEPVYQINFS